MNLPFTLVLIVPSYTINTISAKPTLIDKMNEARPVIDRDREPRGEHLGSPTLPQHRSTAHVLAYPSQVKAVQ